MKIENFAVLSGKKTTIKKGHIIYMPNYPEDSQEDNNNKNQPERAFIRSSTNFGQGTISFKIKAKSPNTGAQICLGGDAKLAGFTAGPSFYTKTFRLKNHEIDKQDLRGSFEQFKSNEEISIKLELLGSQSSLFVNDILFCELQSQLQPGPLSFNITSDDKVEIYDINVQSIKPTLFVVMQFTDNFNKLYTDVIIPIAEKVGFEVIRADEFYTSTPILSDIIKSIKDSSAIIADITPDNPNVFYEIGYAHAINKPTILICDKIREKLPFDVSSFRTLFYENSIAGKSKIEISLKKYLENIFEYGM